MSQCKDSGSEHYQTGGVQPIDLYEAGGMLRDFCLCSIIKYAFRQRSTLPEKRDSLVSDLTKIKHHCDILIERFSK
jgi:hypothetical protein